MSAHRRFPASDAEGLTELRALLAFHVAPAGATAGTGVAAVPEPRNGESPLEQAAHAAEAAASADVVDLVARAQAGDSDAFGMLYDRYVDVVYRYVYYRVNNQSLCEDVVSDTFLRALRRITSFTWQGRDFGAWLVT